MSTRAPDPAVARVAARLQARVKPLADEITSLIAEQIDFYRSGSVVTRADLRRSVEHNFSYMLGQLVRPQPPDLSAPRETGRLRADQGAPLPEILRPYRLGFAFLWERLLAEARHFADNALYALLDTATGIWELADDYCLALTEAYRQAMTSQMISADRRRSALVAALITHAVNIDNVHAAVNYGLNKVRFPAPVPAGSRVRGRVVLASAAPRGDAIEAAFGLTVEIEGAPPSGMRRRDPRLLPVSNTVRDISVRGQWLRVSIRPGNGHPLVLCNGIGASLDLLQPFVDALEPAIPVLRFDVPGVGGSPLPRVPYRFATLARLLGRLLNQFGYGPVGSFICRNENSRSKPDCIHR